MPFNARPTTAFNISDLKPEILKPYFLVIHPLFELFSAFEIG